MVGVFKSLSVLALNSLNLRLKKSSVDIEDLSEVMTVSRQGVWEWQVTQGQIHFNPACASLLGYTLVQVHSQALKTWIEHIHPVDLARAQKAIQHHFNHLSEPFQCDIRFRHKDGHWLWVALKGQARPRSLVRRLVLRSLPTSMVGIMVDISEHKLQQDSLQEALFFQQKIFDVTPHKFAYLDADLVLRYANTSFLEFFELEVDQLFSAVKGVGYDEFFADLMPNIAQVLLGNALTKIHTVTKTQASKSLDAWVFKVLLTPNMVNDQIEGVFLVIEDVTEAMATNDVRDYLAERLDFALKANQNGVWDLDLQTGVLTWDQQMLDLFGFTLEKFNQTFDSWLTCFSDSEARRLIDSISSAIDTTRVMAEIFEADFQGQIRYIKVNAQCIQGEDCPAVRVVGTCRDVSEYVQNQQQLHVLMHTQNRREAMFDAMSEQGKIGAWEMDLVDNKIYWSAQTCKIHEVAEDFVPDVESGLKFHLPGEHRERVESLFTLAIETGQAYSVESRICTAKDRLVWVRCTGQVAYEDGHAIRIFGSCQDIDAQVIAAQELELAKQNAEAATHAKGLFLANMSHELRTPLNGVIGMLRLLCKNKMEEKQAYQLNLARKSAQSLVTLVNDILDFAKIDAGKLKIDTTTFNMVDLVEEIFQSLVVLAEQKNLEFLLSTTDVEQKICQGDPIRIRQVLVNLLGNAIKFTEAGRIKLLVSSEMYTDQQVTYTFAVHDTGIGISSETQKMLFQAFTQADSSITRKYGGTGLGLSIALQLCELMGGGIQVKSGEGQGSCFTAFIILRDKAQSTSIPATAMSATFKSKALIKTQPLVHTSMVRILLVEDDETNQEFTKVFLEDKQYHVVVAANGAQAIELLKEPGAEFACCVMDCQMPVMDGFEATRRIRHGEAGAAFAHLPIIALTAHDVPEQHEKCLYYGMDDFMSKPFAPEVLEAKLCALKLTPSVRVS